MTLHIRTELCRHRMLHSCMYYESQLTKGYHWNNSWILGVIPSHSSQSKNSIPKNPYLHTHSTITLISLNVPNSKRRGCLPETNLVVWMVQPNTPNALGKQAAERCPQADHISHRNSAYSVLSGRESLTTSQVQHCPCPQGAKVALCFPKA